MYSYITIDRIIIRTIIYISIREYKFAQESIDFKIFVERLHKKDVTRVDFFGPAGNKVPPPLPILHPPYRSFSPGLSLCLSYCLSHTLCV